MPSIIILIELIGIVTILAGWGFLSARFLERVARLDLSGFGWFELAVLGTVAAYIFAAVLVLFLPLGSTVALLFTLAGVGGFVRAVGAHRQTLHPWALGSGSALAILAAVGTVHTPLNYDAGLYYLQHVKSLESEGLSLGLANVHSRFGFNSAVLPISTVFHRSVFGQDGLFLVGPALFLVFAGATLEHAASGFRKSVLDAGHFVALFGIASWLIAFNQTVLSWFALSPSGDLVAAAATVYCPVAMLGLCRAAADHDRGAYRRYAVLLPAAAAFAIAAKLSAAPIALLVVLPWLVLGVRRIGNFELRAVTTAMACFAAVLSLWVLHNLLVSGCLVYPASVSCVTWLPWTADKTQVDLASDAIRSWARAPGEPMQSALKGWGWLATWQKNMLPYREFIFTLLKGSPVLLAAALGLRFAFRTSSGDERSGTGTRALLGVWTVNLIGLAYWFFSAPDPRFGLGFMLGTIASSAALLAVSGVTYALDPARARRFAVVVSIAFLALLLNNARLLVALPANPEVMAWRALPVPKTRYMANRDGFTIAVPLTGDQCWEVATLCSPEISPKLTKTHIWGMTAFTVHGTSPLRAIEAPPDTFTSAAPTADSARFAPTVAGEEATTQGGRSYSVRWLQQRTEFEIQHDGPPRQVRIQFRVATYRAERRVWLEQEGQPLPAREVVRKSFWEGESLLVANTVTLHAGANRFAIVTDGSAVDVTPGRPVFLLLVGGIDVANLPPR